MLGKAALPRRRPLYLRRRPTATCCQGRSVACPDRRSMLPAIVWPAFSIQDPPRQWLGTNRCPPPARSAAHRRARSSVRSGGTHLLIEVIRRRERDTTTPAPSKAGRHQARVVARAASARARTPESPLDRESTPCP